MSAEDIPLDPDLSQGPLELLIIERSLSDTAEGAPVTVGGLVGEELTLRSAHPAAPGTRLRARLSDGRELRLKVHRCVRREEHFELFTRMVDAPAGVRRTIAAAVARCGPTRRDAPEPSGS